MILVAGAALAGTLNVVVQDPDKHLGQSVPRVWVTDAAGTKAEAVMNDAAGKPDKTSGDGYFSGAVTTLADGPYAVLVTDGGDHLKWEGTFDGEAGLVAFSVGDGEALVALDAADVPLAPEEAAPPPQPQPQQPQPSGPPQPQGASSGGSSTGTAEAEPAEPPSTGTVLAWLVALAVVGWAVAGTPRGSGKVPAPVPGRRPALPGEGVVPVTGDPAALVVALAGPCRVVLAGRPPAAEVPAGAVFALGTGHVTAEELAEAARALDGLGPPVVVVVATRLRVEAGEDREAPYEKLARMLPRGVVAYAFGTGAPTYEVGEAGELVARA